MIYMLCGLCCGIGFVVFCLVLYRQLFVLLDAVSALRICCLRAWLLFATFAWVGCWANAVLVSFVLILLVVVCYCVLIVLLAFDLIRFTCNEWLVVIIYDYLLVVVLVLLICVFHRVAVLVVLIPRAWCVICFILSI